MLTGRGWRALRDTIPGHRPIAEHDVVLAGVRDLEPYQRERLARSKIVTIGGPIDPTRFERAVSELRARVPRIYLHVDLDALDRSEGCANPYSAPGGPSLERLSDAIRSACRRCEVAAAAITAYDPAVDATDRVLAAARHIAREIAAGVTLPRRGSPPRPPNPPPSG